MLDYDQLSITDREYVELGGISNYIWPSWIMMDGINGFVSRQECAAACSLQTRMRYLSSSSSPYYYKFCDVFVWIEESNYCGLGNLTIYYGGAASANVQSEGNQTVFVKKSKLSQNVGAAQGMRDRASC